jgi:hypothetical protein
MKNKVGGIIVHIPSSLEDATNIWEKLSICKNCNNYSPNNLFEFTCDNPENSGSITLSNENDTCECFEAKDKKIQYMLNKAITATMEFEGTNDYIRQLDFHFKNATDLEFLGINEKN